MNDPLGPPRGRTLRAASWVLYDLANTVYSATLTFVFTPYVKQAYGELGGIGIFGMASMVLAAVLVPLFGALSDHTRRTRGYLVTATALCILAFAGFGLELGAGWLLGCFFVANLTFNVSLLFYNALLVSVAAPEQAGRVGGIGVGVGYVGTILVVGLLPGLGVEETTKFVIAAATFLIFALPCLVLVRDYQPPRPGSSTVAMRAAMRSLSRTLRTLPRHPALLWFLLANLCFVDVLNTAILFFAELTRSLFHAAAHAGGIELLGWSFRGDDGLVDLIKIAGLTLNGLALVFGLSIGGWTDRRPMTVMFASALSLALALVGGAWFGGTSALGYLLTLVVFGSFGLTGIWTAGRKLVVVLAPEGRVGEYFGLYGITVKLSIFGAVVYSQVSDHFGTKPALLSQTPQLCLGLVFLSMVRLPRSQELPPTA